MSSYKLPFGLIFKETTIIRLLLIHRLLFLRYVLVVCHNNAAKSVLFLRNAPIWRKGTKKIPHTQGNAGFFISAQENQ